MIEKPFPTLGPERFQEIKSKVMKAKKARADREKAGYEPPLTDEDFTYKPFSIDDYQ